VARGLATQHTGAIGLVMPDVANPFFSEIARGAEDAAREAGYGLLLCNTAEDPAREAAALRLLEEKRVDGVVLCSSRLGDDELDHLCAGHDAVVLVNRQRPLAHVGCVRVDDAAGAAEAVRHLLRSGRRTVGRLAGPATSHSERARAAGYAAALAEAGFPTEVILGVCHTPDLEGGRAAAVRLLAAHPDVDALLCYNDLTAAGALQACAALGRRVPHDVAVVGCDDIPLARMLTPALTTLRVPQQALGRAAVDLLLRHIAGCADDCQAVVFNPELIVRASAP
jgi:LacI family transcriptional regulator